ncbi:AAA family ATPase [Micromonospora sp. 050-3]|uniref:AAA family ATPase n=1 Tax=Micromonospora sp. 050-3 TaxID=2789265 RepID=UPI003979AE0C
MTWDPYYRGDGEVRSGLVLPQPPPWRTFPRPSLAGGETFRPPAELVEAVNAALMLRRPLLVTGPPGAGKSTLIESVAFELGLGPVLRWHVNSRSTLADALYRYDALGRIHAQQLLKSSAAEGAKKVPTVEIGRYLRLGPLGTALLPAQRPRALLIDEIDKSDLDLPGDLLDVFERGEFDIPELSRYDQRDVPVRLWDSTDESVIEDGRVRCTEFPMVVLTSNGERDFPAPFLRRCVRVAMPGIDKKALKQVVIAYLGDDAISECADLIERFHSDQLDKKVVAVDQLLNAVFVMTGQNPPTPERRRRLVDLLLQELQDG